MARMKSSDPLGGLVVPVRKFNRAGGVCALPKRVTLSGEPEDRVALRQLAAELQALGAECSIVPSGPETHIALERTASVDHPEGYQLDVRPFGVRIRSCAAAGACYGAQTLREILRLHGRSIPCVMIDDAPDYGRRGVYIDCSRGKVPKLSRLKAMVELLAHWKVNELQLNIENVFQWKRHPAIGRGYSPFSPRDIVALREHCKKHHMRLVGAYASFGHQEKILQLPEYVHLAELPGTHGWPGGTTMSPVDPGTIRLLEELYAEFVPLFDAVDFNVNCDEPWELGQDRSKKRADKIGVGRVYLEHLLKIHRLMRKHGKRMNAWSDIVLKHPELLADLPKDVVMLNWDYIADGERLRRTHEIVDAGLPLVVCPGTNGWNSHGCRLKMGMDNIAQFARVGLENGAEGLLNTDWGDNGHRNMLAVSLHNLAFGAAHSWFGQGVVEGDFTERFCRQTFRVRDERMAAAIRTLGEELPWTGGNRWQRQGCLYTNFLRKRAWEHDPSRGEWQLDFVTPEALRRRRAALEKIKWPSAAPDAFLAQMIDEYGLGAAQERLALRRSLALKQVKEGRRVAATEWRGLMDETRALADHLRRVWALGNRPSRLRDLMAGLRAVIREYEQFERG